MNILRSKFFVIGAIVFLLIIIPVTIYFIRHQQEVRSRAEAASTLSLDQSSINTQVGQNFDVTVNVNPGGKNIVSIVKATLNYDKNKLQFIDANPKNKFNVILDKKTGDGTVTVSASVGSDITNAVQGGNNVPVIDFTFKALAPTGGQSTPIKFPEDSPNNITTEDQVFSLASSDAPAENVLQGFADPKVTLVTITEAAPAAPTPTPTPTPTPIPASTTGGQATVNQPPVCNGLGADRSISGNAPLSITFTGSGNDQDGTISKASFDFGDGPAQNVTQGGQLGTNSVSVQLSHTYSNPGTYNASVTFTDNNGGLSTAASACQKTITVTSASATTTGGGTTTAPAAPTPAPRLQSPGDFKTTLGIAGSVIFTILGGALLFGL